MAVSKLNKKAYFFSFIAIMIVTIFVVTFSNKFTTISDSDNQATSVQASLLNSYVKEIKESYIPDVMFTSGKAAILSILFNQTNLENADSYGDINLALNDLMKNGNLSNKPQPLMMNNNLNYWEKAIREISNEIHINTNISFGEVNLLQLDPWTIQLWSIVDVEVSRTNEMYFNFTYNATTKLQVTEFIDPMFLRESSIRKSISKSSLTGFNNIEDSQIFFEEGSYISQTNSPSFLQRLSGVYSSGGIYGIQSFVNQRPLLGNKDVSYVDVFYFNNEGCQNGNTYKIKLNNSEPGFYLDRNSLFKYNLSNQSYYTVVSCTG